MTRQSMIADPDQRQENSQTGQGKLDRRRRPRQAHGQGTVRTQQMTPCVQLSGWMRTETRMKHDSGQRTPEVWDEHHPGRLPLGAIGYYLWGCSLPDPFETQAHMDGGALNPGLGNHCHG